MTSDANNTKDPAKGSTPEQSKREAQLGSAQKGADATLNLAAGGNPTTVANPGQANGSTQLAANGGDKTGTVNTEAPGAGTGSNEVKADAAAEVDAHKAKLAKILVDKAANGHAIYGDDDKGSERAKVDAFMTKIVGELFARSDNFKTNAANALKNTSQFDEYLPNIASQSTSFLNDSKGVNKNASLLSRYILYPVEFIATYIFDTLRVLVGYESYTKGNSILNGGWVKFDGEALTSFAAAVVANQDDKEKTNGKSFVDKILAEKASKEEIKISR